MFNVRSIRASSSRKVDYITVRQAQGKLTLIYGYSLPICTCILIIYPFVGPRGAFPRFSTWPHRTQRGLCGAICRGSARDIVPKYGVPLILIIFLWRYLYFRPGARAVQASHFLVFRTYVLYNTSFTLRTPLAQRHLTV